jgi:hypothetical protein
VPGPVKETDWWDARLRVREHWRRQRAVKRVVLMEGQPVRQASVESPTELPVWADPTAPGVRPAAARRPPLRGVELEWRQPDRQVSAAQPASEVSGFQDLPSAGPLGVPLPGAARRAAAPGESAQREVMETPEEVPHGKPRSAY